MEIIPLIPILHREFYESYLPVISDNATFLSSLTDKVQASAVAIDSNAATPLSNFLYSSVSGKIFIITIDVSVSYLYF